MQPQVHINWILHQKRSRCAVSHTVSVMTVSSAELGLQATVEISCVPEVHLCYMVLDLLQPLWWVESFKAIHSDDVVQLIVQYCQDARIIEPCR